MIAYSKGDIFLSGAEALVNPVNTQGFMGAGLALAFKKEFPGNFRRYEIECKDGRLMIGRMFVSQERGLWIINFPTKLMWNRSSKMEYVIDGLADLKSFLDGNHVKSVAIPALGCGLGGLDWNAVKVEIEKTFQNSTINVMVFEPK